MSTPAFTDDLVTLHHARHQDVSFPAAADLAIIDPPYGDTSLEWDRISMDWLDTLDQAMRSNGSVWLWGSLRHLLAALPAAEERGWQMAQDIVWEKHNGSSSAADRFRRVHEHAVHLYRGRWSDVYIDPQHSLDATPRQVRRKQRPAHWGEIGEHAYRTEDGGPRLLRSVMYERSDHGRAIHPTQKPVGITRTLIQYACPPDGVVIDLFAGSGTTLVPARQAGRRAVGSEEHEPYITRTVTRLGQGDLLAVGS